MDRLNAVKKLRAILIENGYNGTLKFANDVIDLIQYDKNETGWKPQLDLPGYESRINEKGYLETRPIKDKIIPEDLLEEYKDACEIVEKGAHNLITASAVSTKIFIERISILEAENRMLKLALEDEVGIYRNINPSCQKGVIDRCQCNDCRYKRSKQALQGINRWQTLT